MSTEIRGEYMASKEDVIEKIKIILAVTGSTRYDGAAALGISPQSFSQKLYRGSFTAAELITLIDHLGGHATIKGNDWTIDL